MKRILYSKKKDILLQEVRGIGFEDIRKAINLGKHIKTVMHPNQKKYQGQKYMIIDINNYAYVVPFKETEDEIVWITIFPSRKYTRLYIMGAEREYEKE